MKIGFEIKNQKGIEKQANVKIIGKKCTAFRILGSY
jgi:hypothetical protein